MSDDVVSGSVSIWVIAAMLRRETADGDTFSAVAGYRVARTEMEAVGQFLRATKKKRRGFSVEGIRCIPVARAALAAAAGGMEFESQDISNT